MRLYLHTVPPDPDVPESPPPAPPARPDTPPPEVDDPPAPDDPGPVREPVREPPAVARDS